MALSINLGFMVTTVFLTSWGSSSASTALQDPKVTSSEAECHSLKKYNIKINRHGLRFIERVIPACLSKAYNMCF